MTSSASDRRRLDAEPRRDVAARDAADEHAERIRGLEGAGSGLREVELVGVLGKQRRQRREEHRVAQDDGAAEDEQRAATRVSLAASAGGRLSRNARSPSWPSSLVRRRAAICAVASPVGCSRTSCFAARTASGPPWSSASTTCHGAVEIVGDLVHEADAQRRLCVEALAREEVASRCARPDARNDEGRDDGGDDAEPHLRVAEDRVGSRHRDVAAGDEPRAAAEREALDASHDRRRARLDGFQHAIEPHRVLDVLVEGEVDRRALPLDVGAGAKAAALPGEHHAAGVADVGERVGERGDERRVECVVTFRAGERHAQDVPVAADVQPGLSHLEWARGSLASTALISRRTSASSWPKSSRYAWRAESTSAQLVVRQFDRVHDVSVRRRAVRRGMIDSDRKQSLRSLSVS